VGELDHAQAVERLGRLPAADAKQISAEEGGIYKGNALLRRF